jgi:hypothetical protein
MTLRRDPPAVCRESAMKEERPVESEVDRVSASLVDDSAEHPVARAS